MRAGRRSRTFLGRRAALAVCLSALAAAPLLVAQTAGGALDRSRGSGKIRFGYRADSRPFAYKDESGNAAGYSVALCQAVADAIKQEPGLAGVGVEWVPVTADDRFAAVEQGRVDLLCGSDTITLTRRAQVSFSTPTFPGGVGAVMSVYSPGQLRSVISGQGQTLQPNFRGAATNALQARDFTVVAGTTADIWLGSRMSELKVYSKVARVPSMDAGFQAVLDRKSDAFFGERAVLLDAVKHHPSGRDLIVVDRLFTNEPIALAVGRGDEAFRVLVDRTLGRMYGSGAIKQLYTKWFGEPDASTLTFFRWNTLPQ